MDYDGRRNRRGRDRRSRQFCGPQPFVIPNTQSCWTTFYYFFYNCFLLATLITVLYLMVDYNCNMCSAKCDLSNVTKHIEDIAKNISTMKGYYNDLESKVRKFSHELPKIEGQIELLESMAVSMGSRESWSPMYVDSMSCKDCVLPKCCGEHGVNFQNVTKKNRKKSIKCENE